MEKGYTLNTMMRKIKGRKIEAKNMGVEEFFQTLILILMITAFFTVALAFLHLIYEQKE
ncbi:MAG: hypothetical protein QXM22_01110 [Candidatus Bathyarchaeia archaeon]